jgi:hypothetical protein
MAEAEDPGQWRVNYFNYFTETEEHFQRARGTSLFLLSPLDWALIETWKTSGVPLEAVLRGIDIAFEKWRQRKQRVQQVNSLAYCSQAVLAEAQAMADRGQGAGAQATPAPDAPFPIDAVRSHLEKGAAALRAAEGYLEIASAVDVLLARLEEHFADLQQLDQRLSALEDKMAALARTRTSDEELYRIRRDFDRQLSVHRGKMSADQLARLEKSFIDRELLARSSLPRLSLFYLT